MIPPLFILLPVLLLGGVVSTIAGGGLGILLTVAATFFTDVRTSVVLVSLLGFIIQTVKIAHFWRHTRWDIVRWYVILGIPLSFLGGWLLFVFPPRAIEVAVAALCIGYCVLDLLPRKKLRVEPTRASLLSAGAVNGIVGGIVGNGALLRGPALLAFGLTKEQYVGTSSVIAFLLNIGKSSVYVAHFDWSRETTILLLCAIPAVAIGVNVGRRVLRYVSPELFEKILLGIVLIGAVKLLLFPS